MLLTELEKYTDKYRQMLETSGDSGQKILELARENTRLVADQAPKIQIYEEAAHKLTEEKERLNLALRENNTELKDLERLLSESRTESQNLKVRLEERTNDSVAVVKEEHKAALQQLQIKIRVSVALRSVQYTRLSPPSPLFCPFLIPSYSVLKFTISCHH